MSGSQVSLSLVDFTLPSGFKRPESSVTTVFPLALALPASAAAMPSTTQLPQSMSVISSPCATRFASASSRKTVRVMVVAFLPTAGFFLCLGRTTTSGSCGPLLSCRRARPPARDTATCLGQTGSTSFLFIVQSLSHSWKVVLRDAPWRRMNSRRAGTVSPRRSRPCTVGNRASSQPETLPVSTNHWSLRFDISVFTKLRRENSQMLTCGSDGSTSCWSLRIQWYWASRSRYSVVRSAWVTPSCESTKGHAKSYVG
mmetsp:Transcript_10978/g.27748  ORF Transcript_10978/g.27748 Transcript_10978/m.27748 type:complete len:256 (+) Transcript_10978:347-1114(+)